MLKLLTFLLMITSQSYLFSQNSCTMVKIIKEGLEENSQIQKEMNNQINEVVNESIENYHLKNLLRIYDNFSQLIQNENLNHTSLENISADEVCGIKISTLLETSNHHVEVYKDFQRRLESFINTKYSKEMYCHKSQPLIEDLEYYLFYNIYKMPNTEIYKEEINEISEQLDKNKDLVSCFPIANLVHSNWSDDCPQVRTAHFLLDRTKTLKEDSEVAVKSALTTYGKMFGNHSDNYWKRLRDHCVYHDFKNVNKEDFQNLIKRLVLKGQINQFEFLKDTAKVYRLNWPIEFISQTVRDK